jgi:hypothetical protein
MVAGESSGLTKPSKSKGESAPEVLSYRQRLYDRETLMLANEPWNPAQRLAQVRACCLGLPFARADAKAMLDTRNELQHTRTC